jgi:hypothetical protein
VTIGVVVQGARYSGHGPGVNPIISTKDGRIETLMDPDANIALYPGLGDKL